MAPKKREDLKQEDVLQAVVIADSFNVRFCPITEKKPRVLLPVANIPMLDYTLEFLSSSGVQEIFVFCSHLSDQIRTHIRNSKWNESSSSCVVTPVLSEGCRSMGDALREIDAKSLIRSDFVLIYGDTLANIKLQNIVEEHKKRREKDKNSLMTMVFKKAPPGHHTRCKEEEVVMAVENTTNRVVHYRKIGNQKRLEFPVEVLLDHQDVDIRYDLLDCQISICSPQVPQIFTDDFDYQTRDDFVKGILINEEIMGNTIYVNVVKNEYAARISNLQMYDAISKDIISRWVFPLTPDSNINNRENSLSCGRHNVYLSKDVTLARGCILEENVIVGGGSSIGSNTVISQSVIGNNCKIGENVKIMGSYIWNDAVIEDNTVITKAILCDSVHLYKGTTVQPGSVLSWNVKVGPDITLPECVKLTSEPIDDGFGDDLPEADQVTETSPDFGSRGKAYIFKAASDSDDEEELELVHDMWGLNIQSEDEDDISSIASNETDDLSDGSLPPDDYRMFYSEVIDTLRRAREENISTDNMILEVNSLK
ncbi:hypothetical protein KUTeg_024126 [Tegillarca granosa]|uniref:EIF-2B GDP-GTP exchange factor subunit epsilon n=1 Tax=Tegillarca granosa TaxID=220873 RepID=A0ABQ9E277_TEGGR|nr:hypothetical protein KUTeg_024126 [Tegillarca granosa]